MQLNTKEEALEAVKKQSFYIKYVNQDVLDDELINLALDDTGMNIFYIPKDKLTIEHCKKAVAKKTHYFELIPEEMRTQEMCNEIVKRDPLTVNLIPDNKLTRQICLDAIFVRNNTQYVPDRYIDAEFIAEARKINPDVSFSLNQIRLAKQKEMQKFMASVQEIFGEQTHTRALSH